MNFPGMTGIGAAVSSPKFGGPGLAAGAGTGPGGTDPNDPTVKMVQGAMESCYVKTVMSGVVGFGLGGVFGLFMASSAILNPTYAALSNLPLREQLRQGFRDMGSRSWSTAKNFGTVGALFSGIECGIEGLRAKNDIANGVAAGCLTGAILARNAGPQAAAVGCAGFAAFSAAIDAYMRMPPTDD
ncbi:mitochondrial import inner membrane translocase subunit tim-22 [Ophiostoma piceae UAMH 11346]|uniref:Mitochondrial import inner membrane translocase subunit TIM22 n=1 Tax=Ophiostoma piceae (strain UAMH 11346) TaxID=1262450 RepID=S3C7Z6_OPHP1|nr:mitochondrial import inner membrane translocase subunit tim-22 [Ophiostoma piceae UAMH 11346]